MSETAAVQESEEERILRWRREQFRKMLPDDVPNDDIEPLVRNKGVALVDLQKLLGNGCDPHTAVKILA